LKFWGAQNYFLLKYISFTHFSLYSQEAAAHFASSVTPLFTQAFGRRVQANKVGAA